MADEIKQAGRKRLKPETVRVGKRIARFLATHTSKLHCQESCDKQPKEVQPLNAGFFALESLRSATVSSVKERAKRKGKVRSK